MPTIRHTVRNTYTVIAIVVSRAEPPTVTLGLAFVGAAALTDVFLDAGYELVVVDFVFEHHRHIRRYADALASAVPIIAVTLWAPLDIVERRHAERPGPPLSADSAERSWNAMAAQLDQLGAVIDASGTIEQTLAAINDEIDRFRRGPAR